MMLAYHLGVGFMAFVFNGIGTTFYGTRWLPDGTYITTKWWVLCYVPICPLESVRVIEAGPVSGHAIMSMQPLVTQKVPLDVKMTLQVYGWLIAAIAFVPIANWLVSKL